MLLACCIVGHRKRGWLWTTRLGSPVAIHPSDPTGYPAGREKYAAHTVYEEDSDGNIDPHSMRSHAIARMAMWGYDRHGECTALQKIPVKSPLDQKEVKTFYMVRD